MNAGSIYTSARLQATLAAIRGGWASTREISVKTGSMAVHSDIAAIRANGLTVQRRSRPDTAAGCRVSEYRLAEPVEAGLI